jgi:hypothetical protein
VGAIFGGDLDLLSVKSVMRKLSRGVVRRGRASSTKASVMGAAAAGLKGKAKKGKGCCKRARSDHVPRSTAFRNTAGMTQQPCVPTLQDSVMHACGRWRLCARNGSPVRWLATPAGADRQPWDPYSAAFAASLAFAYNFHSVICFVRSTIHDVIKSECELMGAPRLLCQELFGKVAAQRHLHRRLMAMTSFLLDDGMSWCLS